MNPSGTLVGLEGKETVQDAKDGQIVEGVQKSRRQHTEDTRQHEDGERRSATKA